MAGRGACMAGGVHDRGHACWGACVVGACVAGETCMAGGPFTTRQQPHKFKTLKYCYKMNETFT